MGALRARAARSSPPAAAAADATVSSSSSSKPAAEKKQFGPADLIKKMGLPGWMTTGKVSPAAPAFVVLTAAILVYAYPLAVQAAAAAASSAAAVPPPACHFQLHAAGFVYCIAVLAEVLRRMGCVPLRCRHRHPAAASAQGLAVAAQAMAAVHVHPALMDAADRPAWAAGAERVGGRRPGVGWRWSGATAIPDPGRPCVVPLCSAPLLLQYDVPSAAAAAAAAAATAATWFLLLLPRSPSPTSSNSRANRRASAP